MPYLVRMKREAIDSIVQPINMFIRDESKAGLVLGVAALAGIVWANAPFSHSYFELWETPVSIRIGTHGIEQSLHHWINDGLMSMFFFVVGLELKREIMGGELSSVKKAALPIGAAIGGMLFPAGIYLLFNHSGNASNGWGIPMATDIAFALGVLSVLGKRVPISLKIFLTALAVADDLGAVLVIAFFYTSNISLSSLLVAGSFLAILWLANRLGVRNTVFYGVVGIGGLWLSFLLSGVHATVAGVLAALAIPARTKIDEIGFTQKLNRYAHEFSEVPPNDLDILEADQMHVIDKIKKLTKAADTPLQRLEHALTPFVTFVVMPLFALANTGVVLDENTFATLGSTVSLGIIVGLVVGKFGGIMCATFLMTRLRLAQLPEDVRWAQIPGVALLAGIGFTMSLFISNLAFSDPAMLNAAKTATLLASVFAGLAGYLTLRRSSEV